MRNGDENADDIAGRFTGTYTGADARSCKYGTTCEITDKKGKGLPESGKGEALEIPHSPEKEPVSCLTDWHYADGRHFSLRQELLLDADNRGFTHGYATGQFDQFFDFVHVGDNNRSQGRLGFLFQ